MLTDGGPATVTPAPPALTRRFLDAVALASEVHGDQRRTGTQIPYLAHLLVVSGLVLEDGGDEDTAIAAILHDAVEDGGGQALLDQISRRFGVRVAAVVAACSDSIDGDPAEPWIERKRRYLAHLPEIEDEATLRVALADKVHNARSIVRDYREEGNVLWQRFTQKTAREQLWYYGALLEFFQRVRPGPLTEDLLRAVGELAWLVALDEANGSRDVRLWLDPDLHNAQAPPGWIQVRTPDEAIQLLDRFPVRALSFNDPAAAEKITGWLTDELAAGGRDRWPAERIGFHGERFPAWVLDRMAEQVERHSRLRRSGEREWSRPREAVTVA